MYIFKDKSEDNWKPKNTTQPTRDMVSCAGSGLYELTNHSRLGVQEAGFKETGAKTKQ